MPTTRHHHAHRESVGAHSRSSSSSTRVGSGEKREPEPGLIHHRRTDRSCRRSGAAGIRAHLRARRCGSAQWRPATSAARSRKSRCTTSTGARRLLPHHRVNTFRNRTRSRPAEHPAAAFDEERSGARYAGSRVPEAHATSAGCTGELKQTVIDNGNVFAELVNAVRFCSLGQITDALFESRRAYRRSM